MGKIELRKGSLLKRDENLLKFFLRQLLTIGAGAGLYFFLSWLSFSPAIRGLGNVTLRPATAILVLFGLWFGPWVGLLSGILGKTLFDVIAGWGFYWNGSVAYGLIGLMPGFAQVAFQDLRLTRTILRGILWGALGIFLGAIFLSVSGAYLGDVHLSSSLGSFFWPEFGGNLVVVIILLPLLILAISAIDRRKWNK